MMSLLFRVRATTHLVVAKNFLEVSPTNLEEKREKVEKNLVHKLPSKVAKIYDILQLSCTLNY